MATRHTPALRSTPRRTTLACTALAATTALVASGCGWSNSHVRSGVKSYTVTADTAEGTKDAEGSEDTAKGAKDAIHVVDVDTHGGDITFKAAGRERRTIGVTEDLEYDRTKPRTEHTVTDGVLRLTSDDCGGNGGTCVVNYTVSVPPATKLRLRSGGGTITVRGTAGEVSARTDGGDIRVLTSRAQQVEARTGGGDISATFAAAPAKVRCESGGGDVTVRLPRATYAVDATTGGGSREVGVPSGPTSPHEITAHSGGGDVAVLPTS